ncbi:MAG: ABC transporter permease [Acidimicrobiia bacterium]
MIDGLWAWFTDPAQWQGTDGIPNRVFEHLTLSIPPVALAALLAIPIGVVLGHTRRGAFLTISVANVGRALPSFAVLVLALPLAIRWGLGLSYWPAFAALFLLAIPPILVNAYTGVREVDPEIREAARGMGLKPRQILTRTELPIAVALILTGLRIASVHVIATAPLAALAAGGGLGRYIIDGLATLNIPEVLGGAILVAALALSFEAGFSLLQRVTASPGLARGPYLDALTRSKPG